MMLKLYGFKKVHPVPRGHTRDLRVLWALEEMQLPFEIVGLDHPAQDLESDEYDEINPLHQIPSIDDDGNVLTESGAILLHLAKKSGKLIPKDLAGESQVTRWCFVALNSLEVPLMNILMVDWGKKEDNRPYRQFLVGWANRHLGNLERWMANREFIATDAFTVADILMVHVLLAVKDEAILAPYENLRKYRDRCAARPAWKRTLEKYFAYVQPG